MPELPEVETTLRGIAPHLSGKQLRQLVVRQPRLRWPVPTELMNAIEGCRLLNLARRGKYLLLGFKEGTLLIHLGMSGSLRIVDDQAEVQAHDHVDLVFGGGRVLRYTDPRRFGAILWTTEPVEQHPLIAHLGPEPLTDAFNFDHFYPRTRKRKQAIKTLIMDSKVVVGVGNIYANEALFMAGIRPTRAAATLSRKSCEALIEHIKTVLGRAIAQGGTTLKDFVGGDGKPGYFKQQLLVYGRGGQPCVKCQKPLKEIKLGQRATVYCSHCQG